MNVKGSDLIALLDTIAKLERLGADLRTCAECGSRRGLSPCEECGRLVCDRPEYIATQYSMSPDEPSCQQEHARIHEVKR